MKLTTWRDLFSEMLDMTQEQLDSPLLYYDNDQDCYYPVKMAKDQNSDLLLLTEGTKCKSQV